MFKMNNNGILSNYIKHILDNTALPKIDRWQENEYVVNGNRYIVNNTIKLAIKSGIPKSGNDINYFKHIEAYNPERLSDNDLLKFSSGKSYYDDSTHYYFGSYLRELKESKNIDLLSMYNVWGGKIISNFKLLYNCDIVEGADGKRIIPQVTIKNQVNSIDSIYEIMEVRIKPNTEYSLFIDCDTPVIMTAVAYDDGRILNNNTYGSICYPAMRFNEPEIYKVDLKDFDQSNDGELKLVQDYLTLFIQVPKSKKNRLVLEGNYKDNLPILTNDGTVKRSIIENRHGNILINTCPNIIGYLTDGDSIAFNEELKSYITKNAITYDEEILTNIDKLQKYVTSIAFENKYGFRYTGPSIPGRLTEELRTWLYNFESKYYQLNVTGFVDTRLEALIMKGVIDE